MNLDRWQQLRVEPAGHGPRRGKGLICVHCFVCQQCCHDWAFKLWESTVCLLFLCLLCFKPCSSFHHTRSSSRPAAAQRQMMKHTCPFSAVMLLLLPQNRSIYHTSCKKQNCVCVCVWKLIIKCVCHPVCVILLLSSLQRHEGEVCVLFRCVRVTQVLTPVSPTRLFSLARLWSQNKHQPSHRFPHHFWLRASVTLCFLIFSFNHLYPQEPLHYARLFNCKITV